MAIAYDAYSLIGTPAVGSISGTHTPVGTPKGVLIWVISDCNNLGAVDEISTVTYGGVSCTEVTGSPSVFDSSSDDSTVHCFHLGSGIPTGAQTVAVTATASVGINAVYCVTTTASANTEVVDTTVITGTTANPSGTLSLGGVSCFCAQGWAWGGATPGNTPLANWTERQEYDFGTAQAGLTTYTTIGTADVTFGNTCVADQFNYIAIAIRESAGGTTNLVVADATHSHAADNLTLTSNHMLAVSDALHAHLADNIDLSTLTVLAIAECLHGHLADNITLDISSATNLTVAEALHAHVADNLELTSQLVLVIAESAHAHASDNLVITSEHVLAVADALHDHAADNLTLSIEPSLGIADAAHNHIADNLTLTTNSLLAIADAVHTHLADNVNLTYAATLAIIEAMHTHAADNVVLDFGGLLAALSAPRSINQNIQAGVRTNIQTSRR